MTARLIAFVFDEDARACVEQCPQNHIDGVFDQETYDEQTQLNEHAPALSNLPDGVYMMLIQADPQKNPIARISILSAENPQLICTADVDLRPIMVSAIDDGDAYENLGDDDDCELIAQQILLKRAACLEGLFKPYIENNPAFNVRLLDALDYLTYPAIVNKVAAYDLETSGQKHDDVTDIIGTPKFH